MKEKIFILDDNLEFAKSLRIFLEKHNFVAKEYDRSDEFLKEIKLEEPDYLIIDVRLKEINGLDLVEKIKNELLIKSEIIVITAYGSIQDAIRAIKSGAYDYITKPFEPEEIILIIERLRKEKEREKGFIRELLKPLPEIIGKNEKFLKALELAKKVAGEDVAVLLTGESGTGKEVFARFIHLNSKRKEGPFIPINCAAIPKELLENELFGSEKGAFTGSYKTKIGKFELADGGTLFLDEIAEMPLELQPKLLRAIEYKEIERLGGLKPIKVNTRIIAATNRNLKELVEKGLFREDLYYRLSVFPIHLPPLRERKEDILLISENFLKKMERKYGKKLKLNEESKKILITYDFPGNIRELENILERAAILTEDGIIKKEHLMIEKIEDKEKEIKIQNLKDIIEKEIEKKEKEIIENTLKITKGNISKTAEILGISRKSLYEKLKKYKINY
ncbi:MAG: sigma-54 dependent transcriptional regulator [candidate division WOR-3 bacterium]